MSRLLNKVKQEQGYTLIEVLVALTILMIILIPLTQIMSYLLTNSGNHDRIQAVMLAEREMETTVLNKIYHNAKYHETLNGREYQVERVIKKDENKLQIFVNVRRRKGKSVLVRFKTVRLINEIEDEKILN